MLYFVLGLLIAYSVIITLLFVSAANMATIRKRRLKNMELMMAMEKKTLLLDGVEGNHECRTDWPAVK